MTDEDKPDEVIGAVYHGLPLEAPPPDIDAAVLAAACDSVASPRRRFWAVPVSLAAVLVLSVAVTLRMEGERPDVATIQGPTSSAPIEPSQRSPQAQLDARPAEAKPSQARPSAQVDASSAVARAPSIASKETLGANGERLQRAERAKAEAVKPIDERVARQAAPGFVPSPPADPVKSSATTASRSTSESEHSPAGTPPSRPALATPSAPPSAPPAALSSSARSADMQERSAARAEQAPSTAKSEAADSGLAANSRRAPDEWLERIAAMRTEGRHVEADVNLAEFRRIYPKFNIPPGIRERIERRP